MKQLPSDVVAYKKTKVFTQESTPKALLKEHRTMVGVWGKIVILEGLLTYIIEGEAPEQVELSVDKFGVVEPQVIHRIIPYDNLRFYVEFYK